MAPALALRAASSLTSISSRRPYQHAAQSSNVAVQSAHLAITSSSTSCKCLQPVVTTRAIAGVGGTPFDDSVESESESIEQYEERLEARRAAKLAAQGLDNGSAKGRGSATGNTMAEALKVSPRMAFGITTVLCVAAIAGPCCLGAWSSAAAMKSRMLAYLTLLLGFFMAWNIGANDVANAMGTSVGSGALTLRQAVLTAAVLEFGGAFLVGSHVSNTMQNGIIRADMFADKSALLFTGMLSSLAAAGTWLQVSEV